MEFGSRGDMIFPVVKASDSWQDGKTEADRSFRSLVVKGIEE